jgi:hypothetical protein
VAGSTSVTYQATDKLKLSTDIQMAFSRANTQPQGGAYANPLGTQYFNLPTDPVKNADGSWYFGVLQED